MCLLGVPTSYGSVFTSMLSGKCPKDFDLHFLSLWSLSMSLILMLLITDTDVVILLVSGAHIHILFVALIVRKPYDHYFVI